MIRTFVMAMTLCLTACQTPRESAPQLQPEPAKPAIEQQVVKEKRRKTPAWVNEELPEDSPREWSSHEAVQLACRRLNIIRHANCINLQRKAYLDGKPADPAKCKLDKDKGCNHP